MPDSLTLPVTVVAAAVDWLTMSTNGSGDYAALLSWRDRRFAVLDAEGHRETQFSSHGYQYRQRGQVAVGSNGRGGVCTVSGDEAGASWRDLSRIAANVARVDLAITGRTDAPTRTLAREGYRAVDSAPRRRGRPVQVTLISSQDRGDTLYVGSKKSDQLGRLYDKDRESRDTAYKDCWRWEVQYRNDPALLAVRGLERAEDAEATIGATVRGWFTQRGVSAPFRAAGAALDCRPARQLPSDERWLEWARKSVQPRAKLLVQRYGWRYVAECLTGHIATYEDWETMVRGVEFELDQELQ